MTSRSQATIAELVNHARRANARGDFDAALAACDAVFAQDPGNLGGLQAYCVATRFTPQDPKLPLLRTAVPNDKLSPEVRSQVGFMLGKALADIDDLPGAFDAFETANRLKSDLQCQPDQTRAMALRITRMQQAHPSPAVTTPKPVFVLGMPCSGTRLVAAALGAHKDILDLGERTTLGNTLTSMGHFALPLSLVRDERTITHVRSAYQKELPRPIKAKAFIDKMPDNYWYAGVLRQMFPGGLIIHLHRPRIATLWSLWRNDFGAGHHYSYRLPWLVAQYETYQILVSHWRETLGDDWIDLSLDDVVQTPEKTLRPIIDRLGLDWDPACLLDSAPADTQDREIDTLSQWQIHQGISPIIATDWKRFEPLIQDHWAKVLDPTSSP